MHQCHKKRGNTFRRTCKNPPSICPTSIPGFRLLPTSMTISILKTFNDNNSLEFTQNQSTHKPALCPSKLRITLLDRCSIVIYSFVFSLKVEIVLNIYLHVYACWWQVEACMRVFLHRTAACRYLMLACQTVNLHHGAPCAVRVIKQSTVARPKTVQWSYLPFTQYENILSYQIMKTILKCIILQMERFN